MARPGARDHANRRCHRAATQTSSQSQHSVLSGTSQYRGCHQVVLRTWLQASDCTSGVCTGGVCQAPTHTDGIKNDDETGVDCGYPAGPTYTYACADGEGCKDASDCKSAVCYSGICLAPTCKDAVKNGSETGPDCGGECPPCPS